MRFSACYIPTLKESPADAEVVSHKLLLRAGMVRRLTSGLYTYLPLGLRVMEKISRIVRGPARRPLEGNGPLGALRQGTFAL